MKPKAFLLDKRYVLFLFVGTFTISLLLLFAFKIDKSLIFVLASLQIFFVSSNLIIDYTRKKNFYQTLLENIQNLEKAYLVLETITSPNFYEGELLVEALYEINKSLGELMKQKEEQTNDFKEYIEMWIHEVKIPIASLTLMTHNQKLNADKKTLEQLRRLEDYVEQVLYYVRSETASVDYLIKEYDLNTIIGNVALKNKDDLLENKIDLQVNMENSFVYTDAKWLLFILNQIVNNSIKYKKENGKSVIKLITEEEDEKITLSIIDNGIGIKESDLKRVFEKSFTGENGRKKQ